MVTPFQTPITLGGWSARATTAEDAVAMQLLFESDPHYFNLVQDAPPGPAEAQRTFALLPDGKSYDDKFTLTLTDDLRRVVGVIDIVRDYPRAHQWFLGLLFISPSQRSAGQGARIVEDLITNLRNYGARELRIAAVERNEAARRFWVRTGFSDERRVLRKLESGLEIQVNVMVKAV